MMARPLIRLTLAIAVIAVLSACNVSSDGDTGDATTKINGSLHIAAGKPAESAATVNGSIAVDANAAVTSANTVNGRIELGDNATAGSLNTVNGSITIGKGARISKSVAAVNGALTLLDGADVQGSIGNVNGMITVTGAHVGGGIKTVAGNIQVNGNAHVEGGIWMEKTSSVISIGNDIPRVVIGPGATVQGTLKFDRDVRLFVSDKATIGPVTGATPVAFSGDTPPSN